MTTCDTSPLIGYARALSQPASLAAQAIALQRAGCSVVHQDDASSAQVLRPGLAAALAALSPGRALCVVSLDRLARTSRDLFAYAADLTDRGAHLVSLAEDIDTRRDNGAFLGFCAILEQLHANGQADRRASERALASRGPGPAPKIPDEVWARHEPQLRSGELSPDQAARLFGVHRSTVYRRMGGT